MTRAPGPGRSSPRLARWLLRLALPGRLADPVLGDLEEEFRSRVPRGRARAYAWYWGQALRSLPPALGMTRTGGEGGRMAVIGHGIHFALRATRRAPGFAAMVVLTLALGMGANVTMFSFVDHLLLRPPAHVRDAERVRNVYVARTSPFSGRPETSPALSYPDLLDFEGVAAFSGIAGYNTTSRTLGSGASAERVRVQLAGGALFEVLGVSAHLGRLFGPDDDAVGGATVAVLSHGFWARRFAADPGVLGRQLDLGEGSYTVVGVAPPGFTGAIVEPVDVWVPMLSAQSLENGTGWVDARRWYWFRAVARLADGVSDVAAAAAATATHRAGRTEEVRLGRYDADASVVLGSTIPGQALDAGREMAVTRWVAGVAAVVLLITCANVANLLLVRGIRWRRELAVRRALGVPSSTVAVMLGTEIALLAGAAASAAVLVAWVGGGALFRVLLPGVAPPESVLGPRLLLFAGGAAATSALLAGVAPVIQSLRGDVPRDLKEAGRRSSRAGKLRAGLLVAQVALSSVLLVGAGLFLRSLAAVEAVDLGFDADRVLVGMLETQEGSFNEETSRGVVEASERLRGAPGIEALGTTSLAPFRGLWGGTLERAPGDTVRTTQGPYYYAVDDGYLETMGVEVVRGRGFEAADLSLATPPVMVVTESLARSAFGEGDAIGRCLLVAEVGNGRPPCTTVVGIVRDHVAHGIDESDSPYYYLPPTHPAAARSPGLQMLIVRTAGVPTDLIGTVRATLLASVPGARFANVAPLQDSVDLYTRSWRLGATLFGIFGGLALVVAALGLHALLAFDVAERRRDLAVRSALGATQGTLFAAVVGRAVALTAGGAVLGIGVSLAFGRALADLLYRVDASDPLVLVAVAGTLLGVSMTSTLLPARRAGRIAPAEVLRGE